jgi:hypothetical protein
MYVLQKLTSKHLMSNIKNSALLLSYKEKDLALLFYVEKADVSSL